MIGFSKLQIAALVGFVLLLVAIPLTFSLVKQTQNLRSSAREIKQGATPPNSRTAVTSQKAAGDTALSDLQKLLQQTTPSLSPAPSSSPTPADTVTDTSSSTTLSFGPTLNMTINIEGRPAGNQAAKVFVGIATGSPVTKPAYLLSFTVNFPASGVYNDLSLAGLDTGTVYTAYLKGPGQIDTTKSFTMNAGTNNLGGGQPLTLLSGDLNEDNTVNTADYTIAKSLYGKTSANAGWNESADFNKDGLINNLDIAYVLKNFGKTGDSGVWYSPPPIASPSANLNTGVGGVSTNSGGYWLWVPPLP